MEEKEIREVVDGELELPFSKNIDLPKEKIDQRWFEEESEDGQNNLILRMDIHFDDHKYGTEVVFEDDEADEFTVRKAVKTAQRTMIESLWKDKVVKEIE